MIKLYSLIACSHCNDFKAELDKAGIPYEFLDLDDDKNFEEAGRIAINYLDGNTELPIVEKDGKYFSRPKIEDL